jgi:hypothetical protein
LYSGYIRDEVPWNAVRVYLTHTNIKYRTKPSKIVFDTTQSSSNTLITVTNSPTMRSSLLLTIALPALALAAPPSAPQITQSLFWGRGCPHDSGSVKADSSTLDDTFGVSFKALKGSTTDNCAVHIQSSGASAGWQVAVKEITYEGDVNLKGNSELDTYTQVFWSENAGNTVRPQHIFVFSPLFLFSEKRVY